MKGAERSAPLPVRNATRCSFGRRGHEQLLQDLDLERIPAHVGDRDGRQGQLGAAASQDRTEATPRGRKPSGTRSRVAVQVAWPMADRVRFSVESLAARAGSGILMNFNRSLLRRRRDECTG